MTHFKGESFLAKVLAWGHGNERCWEPLASLLLWQVILLNLLHLKMFFLIFCRTFYNSQRENVFDSTHSSVACIYGKLCFMKGDSCAYVRISKFSFCAMWQRMINPLEQMCFCISTHVTHRVATELVIYMFRCFIFPRNWLELTLGWNLLSQILQCQSYSLRVRPIWKLY